MTGDDLPLDGRAPARLLVALLGLPPVYRRGLTVGLADAGYDVHDPGDVHDWIRDTTGKKLVMTTDSDRALQMLDTLRASDPEVLSVVLLEEVSPSRYSRALPRCTGALPLHAELEDVFAAVRAAASGFTLLPTEIARVLTSRGDLDREGPDLGPRERAWLRSLADGATVASLARNAGYSEREMYRLLSSLYERLGASTRTGALLRADRWGLLDGGKPAPKATPQVIDLTQAEVRARRAPQSGRVS